MDKEQIQICKHIARAYRHIMMAQSIVEKNKWDNLSFYDVIEPLSKLLAGWVDDVGDDELEIKEVAE